MCCECKVKRLLEQYKQENAQLKEDIMSLRQKISPRRMEDEDKRDFIARSKYTVEYVDKECSNTLDDPAPFGHFTLGQKCPKCGEYIYLRWMVKQKKIEFEAEGVDAILCDDI